MATGAPAKLWSSGSPLGDGAPPPESRRRASSTCAAAAGARHSAPRRGRLVRSFPPATSNTIDSAGARQVRLAAKARRSASAAVYRRASTPAPSIKAPDESVAAADCSQIGQLPLAGVGQFHEHVGDLPREY